MLFFRNRYFLALFIPLFLLLPSSASLAQGNSANTNSEELITLSLDNASVLDLVRWASDATDMSIVVHPNVQGRITVVAGAPMTKDQAYQVFLSILQVHGLAMVNDGNALLVVPGSEAKTSPLPVTDENTFSLNQDMVIHLLPIRNASASNVVNLLRPLMPQTGYLAAYPNTNTLLIADSTRNINKLLDVIAQIDRSEGQLEIEMIPVLYASAREISSIITSLVRSGQQEGGSTLEMAVDERSNSILITGDPVTRGQVKSLITRLDTPLDGNGNTQVIRVQYSSAEELVPILQSVANSLQREVRDQSVTNVEVSIQAQTDLNAIVITAPPSIITVIKGIVGELDIPRSQVLVEALIVEVNQDLINDLGVQWQSEAVSQNGAVGGFSLFPSSLAPVSDIADGGFNLGTGLSFGYYQSGEIRTLVNALSAETNANILSTPTILALDNEEAEILVGSSVPFITGTEEREGDTPFQTIERQDIGISLKVKPHVNNDDSVTLEIEQSVESIGQTAEATADIITNKREITTKVLIRNNQTLVLGGLIRDEATDVENKVPILGDIPILGKAFRSTSTSVVKTNLIVFIHPTILRTSIDADNATEERYNYMLDLQDGFRSSLDPADRFWYMKETPELPELQRGTAPDLTPEGSE